MGFACFSSSREDCKRAGKAADMKTVLKVACSTVGGVANFYPVYTIPGSDYAQGAVLKKEFAVVRGGNFKTLIVKNSNVGIKKWSRQTDCLNLYADSLALGCIDFVKVHILAEGHSVDG